MTTSEVTQGITFTVPSENLSEITTKLEKLNKKAARLGTAPISIEVLSTEVVEEKVSTNPDGLVGFEPRTIAREWSNIAFYGETPMLNGWQFVATLVHGENGAIISRVPTFDGDIDLSSYREANPSNCDHCGLDRRRNDTFIVYNAETGETQQVGRQCLKDFLGYNDPQAIIRQLERVKDFLAYVGSDDEDGGRFSRGPAMFDVEGYLIHVFAMIRLHGWLSASAASYDEMATSVQAFNNMMNYGKKDKFGKMYEEFIDEDVELAKVAIAWNKDHWNLEGNEFEGNMAVAYLGDYFQPRVKGFVAYGAAAFLKDRNEQIERERKAQNPSQHVGTVGKREVFKNLTVSDERVIEGYYGTTILYTMFDEQGNDIKWFASRRALEVGQVYNLKATVKKHEEYKGVKQTILTRAVVV